MAKGIFEAISENIKDLVNLDIKRYYEKNGKKNGYIPNPKGHWECVNDDYVSDEWEWVVTEEELIEELYVNVTQVGVNYFIVRLERERRTTGNVIEVIECTTRHEADVMVDLCKQRYSCNGTAVIDNLL